jgi:hypothetical protein
VVRTRAATGLAPAVTMGATRIKRNIGRESSVGMIATFGDPLGRPGAWLVGPDLTLQTSRFRGSKNLQVGLWGLVMARQTARGDKTAAGVRIAYPNDLWNIFGAVMRIGDGFDPAMGFVPRPGVYSYRFVVTNTPKSSGWLRQMEHEVQNNLITDLAGRWESYRIMIVPLNWRLASGDGVEFNAVPTGEQLPGAFEVADNLVIPVGPYHWRRYRIEGVSAAKRTFSGRATWWFGGFYDGRLDQIQLSGTWHPSPLVTVEASGERNVGDLREGRFTQTLVGARARVNVSPDLQVGSYIQYDTESRSVGSNTKLRWTFRPLGDLFVIYNHNVRSLENRWRLESTQLLVKLQYALRY